jgi:hypothetical protein
MKATLISLLLAGASSAELKVDVYDAPKGPI